MKNVFTNYKLLYISIIFNWCNFVTAQDSTIYLNNKQYELVNSTWYVKDSITDELFRVDNSSISVKLNEGSLYSLLEELCNTLNIQITRNNILGYTDLFIPQNTDVFWVHQQLQNSGLLSYIGINSIGKILSDGGNNSSNDPGYSLQYHLHNNPYDWKNINAEYAWWVYTDPVNTPQPSVVAVIDVGVDGQHLDLNLTNNGYDFYLGIPNAQPLPNDHHGTGVAGIIGARTNNGNGVAGVAGGWNNQYETKIMPLRVGRISTDPNDWEIFASLVDDAIIYAVENGARIINMSFKLESNQPAIISAIEYAYKVKGCLLVAGSGNVGRPPVNFPASNQYVVAVGGVGQAGGIAGSYGPELDVVAPAVGIYSTINSTPQDRYRWGFYDGSIGNGTSASSPMVAGAAALLLAYMPDLIHIDLKKILQKTAIDLGSPGFDQEYGYGLINVGAASDYLFFNIPPQNLTLQVIGTHAQLTWETVDGVGAYKIYKSSSRTGRYNFSEEATISDNNLPTQSWIDWSYHIFPGSDESIMYYRVTALKSNNESYSSNEVNVNYGGATGGEMDKAIDNSAERNSFDYYLDECYPNPFNPSTNINFSVREKGFTSLKVYNIMGEEVAILINKAMEPGAYSVKFSPDAASSGIYIYTLISGSFTKSKKMIFVK